MRQWLAILALVLLLFTTLQGQAAENGAPATANKIEGPATGQLDDRIELNIRAPAGSLAYRDPAVIQFCDHVEFINSQRYCTEPRRPLHLAGKRVVSGIAMTPAVAGEWRRDSDYSLRFTPRDPWPAGKRYAVKFDPALFPAAVRLLDTATAIETEALHASIGSPAFFQDQNEIGKRGVSASLAFNTPVAGDALKEHLTLRMVELSAAQKPEDRKILSTIAEMPFDLRMNDDGLSANIAAAITTMPDKERFIEIEIRNGLPALAGGEALASPRDATLERRSQRVRIPSRYDYAQFNAIEASIVQNEHYVPQQTVVIESNLPVSGAALAQNLHIYQLPKDKPPAVKDGKPDRDYRWTSASEVTDEILAQSEELKFAMDTQDSALVHGVKIDAVPGRWLYLRIAKGTAFPGGYILGEEHRDTVEAPEYTKEVRILTDGALLSLSGERKISLYSLGAGKVRFEVGRVVNEDIGHLASQTRGSFESPRFDNYNFDQENVSEKFTKELDLSSADPRKPQFNAFDFAPFLKMRSGEKGKLPPQGKGLFFLTVKALAKDETGAEQVVSTDRRFILVSDLGIIVKTGADGHQDLFLQSIATGSPVAEARVEVLGLNGLPVATVGTDAQGHAVIPSLAGLQDEKRPVAYLVRKGDDMAFMPYEARDRGLDYSKFDTEGLSDSGAGLRAYLFSDRGVYRPGEEVHIGMIVKQGDWSQNLQGVPLTLEVTNPRGQVIESRVVKLEASGAGEFSFSTRDTSPTGLYNLRLYIAKDGRPGDALGSTSVRVEEFIPDTLKISAAFNKPAPKGWLKPEGLTAEVTLAHLYGAPAADHRVVGSLSVAPGQFNFKEFPGYSFFDALTTDKSFEQPAGEAQTDAAGHASFGLQLDQFGRSTYRLVFGAEGFAQDSGRSVLANTSALVSPLPFVVGVKADGNLGYINKNEKRSLNLIAVDPDLTRIAVGKLTASLTQVTYVSSLIKDERGAYQYRSVAKETPVSSAPLDIPATGLDYAIDTSAPGSYTLAIADADGLVLHRISYSIIGEGSLIDHARKDAVITVRLDREKYAAGGKITLNIASPYTGAGLITLETDKVLAFKWFKAKTTSSVQTIDIPKGFTGKGFVNVQFVRALGSREVYTSPLAYAVQPFLVDTDTIDSHITLSVPEKVKPGEDLAISYSTGTSSRIILYGVDEGILQYAHYKTPDPLNFFVNRRALQVETTQILDLLMPEYSLLRAATGGDGGGPDGRNVNPFKRKTEAPVAFWSGIIEADKTARVYHYKVPDRFNGKLRVIAVAVSAATMGVQQTEAHVRGDIIISPNVPVFAAPGDSFTVGISLANNLEGSGKDAKVILNVAPSAHLEIIDGAEKEVPVAEGTESKASVTVRVKDILGGAALSFTATLKGASAKYEGTLSVRPPLPSMTALVSGYVEKGDATIRQDRDLYKEFASAEAAVSTLPVSLVPGLATYLDRYPYGCTEQTISRAFPAVTLYGQKDLGGNSEAVQQSVVNAMRRLRELQNSRGGFAYWWYGGRASDFVSIYALHYMTLAREKHLPVPDETFRRAQQYVREVVSESPASLDEARVQAYGIYILTRGGIVTANYLPHLLQYLETNFKDSWKSDLAAVYIAAAYRLMQLVPEANALLAEFTLGEPVYWKSHGWYFSNGAFYNSLNRYAQYLTIVADHFPETLPKLDRDILFRIANFIGEGSFNTLSSSYAIMAFSAYGQAATAAAGADLAISQDGRQLPLSGELIRRAQLALEKGGVTFGGGGEFGLFYQVATDGYDRAAASQAIEDGLEITREYFDKQHKPVSTVPLGETVDVLVRFRAHDDKTLPNMAIVDLLPGGFELVPQSIQRPVTDDEEEDAADDGMGDEDTSWFRADTWRPEAVDARDDRVIAFGSVSPSEAVYHYRIKAVNRGSFTVPPAYAESMYERSIKARGTSGTITVP